MIIKYSKEVEIALKENKPIVALESTIISHGMPYPTNLLVAKTCEQIIRDNGCTPATICIIDGIIKVGINEEELEYLATSKDILKVSRRDLAYTIALKKSGATTVAATMIIAKMANIKFFATGGIGGVHKGVMDTLDISSDLEELQNTNVCVVCAGVKSILDLPKTMEYLETKGVLVIGYNTDTLPEFFTREGNIKVPLRVDNERDIASIMKTMDLLNITNGLLVTNPIDEKYSLSKVEIDNTIDEAIKEMNEKNITGKQVTPYLLQRVNELTKGLSLESNMQLVYNNCKLASMIAAWYFK